MARYTKTYSNYIIRKEHQLLKGSTIFDEDKFTIGGVETMMPGQTPLHGEGNFIFTINNTPTNQKKNKFGVWEERPDSCSENENSDEVWTNDCVVSSAKKAENGDEVKLTYKTDRLVDYAYYGSCTELIRASVEGIIRDFPAELYFSDETTSYYDNASKKFVQTGKLVRNDYGINLVDGDGLPDDYENPLRLMSYSFNEYEVLNESSDKGTPVTSFSVTHNDKDCYVNGDTVCTVNIGGKTVNGIYIDGNIFYTHTSSGTRIRPNASAIERFFEGLDDFQKILLDRKTDYTARLKVPVETEKGITFVTRKYKWPKLNGYNLDISSAAYSDYITSLTNVSELMDERLSDNIYRQLTHESIKNFDWTYRRDYDEGLQEMYLFGGNRVANLLRVYGRMLDDLKRYIDSVAYTTRISYSGNNDMPDYLVSDQLSNSGWEVTDIIKAGSENFITDNNLYNGITYGYKFSEVNVEFMKRLAMFSKYIFSSKGTVNCIDMVMSMFNIPNTEYKVTEYVYEGEALKDKATISLIKELNSKKYLVLEDNHDPFSGLMVKEIDEDVIIPWFDKEKKYDGNPYFQCKGGWLKGDKTKESFNYTETQGYINVVENISQLFTINLDSLNPNDVYYVNNIDDISQYPSFSNVGNGTTSFPSNYFVLSGGENASSRVEILNSSRTEKGWDCIPYTLQDGDKVISNERVVYMESIISKSYGNNPHVGYGHYDMGEEYLDYVRKPFKYSIENNAMSSDDIDKAKEITFSFELAEKVSSENIDVSKVKNNWSEANKVGTVDNTSEFSLNSKVLVIENTVNEKNYIRYFRNFVLPYLEQVIPSTSIVVLVGYNEDGSGSFVLNRNLVRLNTSDNSIEEATVRLYTDLDNVSNDENDVAYITVSGDSVEVKKKNKFGSDVTTFSSEGLSVGKLTVVYSGLDVQKELNFDSAMSSELVTVTVNGSESSTNYHVNGSCSWLNTLVTSDGLLVDVKNNDKNEVRNCFLQIIHNDDPNCYRMLEVIQEANKFDIKLEPIEIGVSDSSNTNTVDVTAIGGSEDYEIVGIEPINPFIKLNKNDSKSFDVVTDKGSLVYGTDYTVTVRHKDDASVTETAIVRLSEQPKYSITIKLDENDPGVTSLYEETGYSSGKLGDYIVLANGGSMKWKIKSGQTDWLELKASGNILSVNVSMNNSSSSRSSNVVLCHMDDESETATLTVTQNGYGECSISVEPSKLEFTSEGGVKSVNVTVTGKTKDFKYSNIPSWITSVRKGISSSGVSSNTYTLTFTVDEGEKVEDSITLTHIDDSSKTCTVTIVRDTEGKYEIELYCDETGSVSEDAHRVKFDVSIEPSDAPYIISSSSSWASPEKPSGKGNGSFYVNVDKNTAYEGRSCQITVKHALDSLVTDSFIINQGASSEPTDTYEFNVSPGSIDFGPEGGTATITITSTLTPADGSGKKDVGWSFTGGEGFTVTKDSSTKVTVKAGKNEGGTLSGTITFTQDKSGMPPVTVTIKQGEAPEEITGITLTIDVSGNLSKCATSVPITVKGITNKGNEQVITSGYDLNITPHEIKANETESPQYYIITVTYKGFTATKEVTQDAGPCTDVFVFKFTNPSSFSDGSTDQHIIHNCESTVNGPRTSITSTKNGQPLGFTAKSDSTWIDVDVDISQRLLKWDVEENTVTSPRTGKITVTQDETEEEVIYVTVNQEAATTDVFLSFDENTVVTAKEFEVSANDTTVTYDYWLKWLINGTHVVHDMSTTQGFGMKASGGGLSLDEDNCTYDENTGKGTISLTMNLSTTEGTSEVRFENEEYCEGRKTIKASFIREEVEEPIPVLTGLKIWNNQPGGANIKITINNEVKVNATLGTKETQDYVYTFDGHSTVDITYESGTWTNGGGGHTAVYFQGTNLEVQTGYVNGITLEYQGDGYWAKGASSGSCSGSLVTKSGDYTVTVNFIFSGQPYSS